MRRTVEWEQWQTRRRSLAGDAARRADRLTAARRTGGGRVRDPEDVTMLTRAMQAALKRRVAEGRLVRLGPREYELRLRGTLTSPSERPL
jgi:hypothetical protein